MVKTKFALLSIILMSVILSVNAVSAIAPTSQLSVNSLKINGSNYIEDNVDPTVNMSLTVDVIKSTWASTKYIVLSGSEQVYSECVDTLDHSTNGNNNYSVDIVSKLTLGEGNYSVSIQAFNESNCNLSGLVSNIFVLSNSIRVSVPCTLVDWYLDNDNDSYGDYSNAVSSCTQPSGYVLDNSDCNDLNSAVNPSATEVCDEIDNNCDSNVDEFFDVGTACFSFEANSCGDFGLGNKVCTIDGTGTECNAVTPSERAFWNQICESSSNDCGQTNSGLTDCDGVCDASTPSNPDGYGNECSSSANSCGDINSGTVQCDGSCDATVPDERSIWNQICSSDPNVCGETSLGLTDCDGVCDAIVPTALDSDGDSVADCVDNCASIYNSDQLDSDADGLGDSCDLCPNTADSTNQFDDDNDSIGNSCDQYNCVQSNGGIEVCDGIDNNCDGQVDEGLTQSTNELGACSANTETCVAGIFVADNQYTPIDEIWNNEIDDNCDGNISEDYVAPTTNATATVPREGMCPAGIDGCGTEEYKFGKWTNKSVTVSLNVDETATTYYGINSAPENVLLSSIPTFDLPGIYTIYYYSVDSAGNNESIKEVKVLITAQSPIGGNFEFPENSDLESADNVTLYSDWTVNIGSNGSQVFLPAGTVITTANGSLNLSMISSMDNPVDLLSGLDSWRVLNGTIQFGIPNLGLIFSNNITIRIFVGTEFDNQTLDILRSTTGSGDWNTEGFSSTTCTVSAGICEFNTTKASYFAATSGSAPAPEQPRGGGGGGGSVRTVNTSVNATNTTITENNVNSAENQTGGSENNQNTNAPRTGLLTGAVIGALGSKGLWTVVGFIVIIGGAYWIVRRKRISVKAKK
jgi:hypothetical protein